ncbi:hypothetical protein PYW07_012214 [Mythimna separata]|uniref:Uncharacterized protein n=2 Tax=Mythimna separata TaxID=271217 RepID=A0AAD7YKS9_MYTSE|nr:hypothetical protein PYW07_012214 [Mythimna separata]
MSKFSCLAFCVVVVSLNSVLAEDGPANEGDVLDIVFECAKENEVKASEILAVMTSRDVTLVNPCLWSCCLKKGGFIDDKGQYVLNPGLTYVKNIVKSDQFYTFIEKSAKQCESVKDKAGSECELGALLAACILEQMMKM